MKESFALACQSGKQRDQRQLVKVRCRLKAHGHLQVLPVKRGGERYSRLRVDVPGLLLMESADAPRAERSGERQQAPLGAR